jgi:hypothetical protein
MISVPKRIIFCLGAQKSATSWLFNNISNVPGLYASRKEFHYFSRVNVDKEGLLPYYRQLTLGTTSSPSLNKYYLDFSTSYYSSSMALNQLSNYMNTGQNCFILIHRNPIDRLVSHCLNDVAAGKQTLDFLQSNLTLDSPFVVNSTYNDCIDFLLRVNTQGLSPVLVDFQSIVEDPFNVLLALTSHLSIPFKASGSFERRINPSRFIRKSTVDRLMASVAHSMSASGFEKLRYLISKSGLPDIARDLISSHQTSPSTSIDQVKSLIKESLPYSVTSYLKSSYTSFLHKAYSSDILCIR